MLCPEILEDGLWTVDQVAAYLGVSRWWVYNTMNRGELSYIKTGRVRRIPRQSLASLVERSLVGGEP